MNKQGSNLLENTLFAAPNRTMSVMMKPADDRDPESEVSEVDLSNFSMADYLKMGLIVQTLESGPETMPESQDQSEDEDEGEQEQVTGTDAFVERESEEFVGGPEATTSDAVGRESEDAIEDVQQVISSDMTDPATEGVIEVAHESSTQDTEDERARLAKVSQDCVTNAPLTTHLLGLPVRVTVRRPRRWKSDVKVGWQQTPAK